VSFINAYRPFLEFGDFADVYLEESESLSILWENGGVQNISKAHDKGAGIRILQGLETLYAHSTMASPLSGFSSNDEKAKLDRLFQDLTRGLKKSGPKTIAEPAIKNHPLSDPPGHHSLQDKIGVLDLAFQTAKSAEEIRQVTGNYLEKIKRIGYLNSAGETFLEERTYLVFNLTVTAQKGSELQTAYQSMGGLGGFELLGRESVQKLAWAVRERARNKLEAPLAPMGEMPVVIASSAGGTIIHEAVGHSLEADHVLQGTSPAFAGKIGKIVASEKVTVLDDPTLQGARGSYFFDDEGIPAQKSILIENGILKDYMLDRKAALQMKLKSNGHGRRESFSHRPIPRMSNTFVAPGKDNPEAILKSLRKGFLVTKMGGGQVNTANGDFVFDVEEGYEINAGRKTLVRKASLLGNGLEVLKSIDMVGSDLGWSIGTCGKEGQGVPVSDGLPTIRIKKLVIGGGRF